MVRLSSGKLQTFSGPVAAPQTLDWLNGDVARLRADYERMRARPVPHGARWIEIKTADGTIRVLAHGVSRKTGVAIVYFHGGGFIVGSPLTHADITEALWQATGMALCSIDYRLAPEHKAPAPAKDGFAVISYLLGQGFGGFIICGDSAGGAIALALEATASPELRAKLRGVCSLYGAYGLVDSSRLHARGSRVDGTDVACINRYFDLAAGWDDYSPSSLAKPSAVPVYLVAAGEDPLLHDSILLAGQLRQQDRDVSLDIVACVGHGFLHEAGTSMPADETIHNVANWMQCVSR